MAERLTMLIPRDGQTPQVAPSEFDTRVTDPDRAFKWAVANGGLLNPLQAVEVVTISGIAPPETKLRTSPNYLIAKK